MDIRAVTPLELEQTYLALAFPDPPEARPYVIVNMVSSADGSVTVVDEKTGTPSERGLGSKLDQRMMRVLRTLADGTLNGAQTLRLSGAGSAIEAPELQAIRTRQGKTTNPIAFSLTGSAQDLPLDPANPKSSFFYSKDFEAVLFAEEGAAESDLAAVRATGRAVEVVPGAQTASAMLRVMRQKYGIRLLLCEGGPAVNGSLLEAGAIDEFFLTFTPKLVGGGKHAVAVDPPLSRQKLAGLEPLLVLGVPETGETYYHFRARR